jgi:hypothetical protein
MDIEKALKKITASETADKDRINIKGKKIVSLKRLETIRSRICPNQLKDTFFNTIQ